MNPVCNDHNCKAIELCEWVELLEMRACITRPAKAFPLKASHIQPHQAATAMAHAVFQVLGSPLVGPIGMLLDSLSVAHGFRVERAVKGTLQGG
jgi:hypothetical protein